MQRILSILLAMVLGLGPTLAAVPASAMGWAASAAESRLPACCRKNGAHHCAMSMQSGQSALSPSSETTLSAANCCPCWPGTLASTTASIAATVNTTSSALAMSSGRYAQHLGEPAKHRTPLQTHPKRGPPSPTSI